MAKITDVKYFNFGPFINAEFKLADRGLVLVQGENQVSSSADSNGSGKSYLLEGIVWCKWAKTLRGVGPDEVVNNKAGKNCLVYERIDIDGQILELYRYRAMKAKHGHKDPAGNDLPTGAGFLLFVDGLDKTMGTVRETEALMEELIGMDYNTFIRSVYFDGKSIAPFPTLTDREIKEIFERVLNLDSLGRAADVAKKRRDTAASIVSGLRSSLALIESNITTFRVELMDAEQRAADVEVARANKIAELQRDQALVTAPTAAFIAEQEEVVNARELAIRESLKPFGGLEALIDAHRNATIAVFGEINTAEHEITVLRNSKPLPGTVPAAFADRLAAIRHGINATHAAFMQHKATHENASAKIGTACSGCGKTYTTDDLGSIAAHALQHMNQAGSEHRDFQEQNAAISAEIAAFMSAACAEIDAQIVTKKAAQDAICAKSAELQAKTQKFSELRALKQAKESELASVPSLRAEIERLRSTAALAAEKVKSFDTQIAAVLAQPNTAIAGIERFKARLSDANAEYAAGSIELAEADRKLALAEFMLKAYGQGGLKAHILQVITPALNERANEYAQSLADGALKIEFTTTKQNKDGTVAEKFGVIVTNNEGSECYLGNSSGERRKIDLAIAFALSDLVIGRSSKSFDFWAADEIAESLDPTALDRVINVLGDIAKARGTVLVISHTDMTPYISNVTTVRKTAMGSVLA